MKGSSVRAAKPSAPFGYLPDLIVMVAEHYGFVERPTEISQLISHGTTEAQAPAIFRHGKVIIDERPLVIEELQVFNNGTIVATPGDTADADAITDDVFRWANETLKIEFEAIKPIGHFSQLEVRFEKPLQELFSPFLEIGRAINESLDPFWSPMPTYELINLHFGIDSTRAPKVNPGVFKIERRSEIPFEMGLYFCEASMTTRRHIAILERFEQICLDIFTSTNVSE